MLTSDFDYELPEERIAQFPGPRGAGRLLVLGTSGRRSDCRIRDLPRLLRTGDLLVVNNTRVIPARLFARREDTGGRLEMLLVERLSATEWIVLARPAQRARPASRFELGEGVVVAVTSVLGEGRRRVEFSEPIEPHLERLGHVPLPPYIRRPDRAADRGAYQTIFASSPGAIAAPTAGLHFTDDLVQELGQAGIELAEITLHVGIGTFRPVSVPRIEGHRMDAERFEIPPAAAAAIVHARERGGRVVAVGTTVVRTLESAARSDGGVRPTGGLTDLFITPGYRFRAVDLLLTNFHLPRSTLLMLVCAFAGRESVLAAYRHAISAGYRFYSYGDAMLLERADRAGS